MKGISKGRTSRISKSSTSSAMGIESRLSSSEAENEAGDDPRDEARGHADYCRDENVGGGGARREFSLRVARSSTMTTEGTTSFLPFIRLAPSCPRRRL